jgi:hypothetical protein
VHRRQQRAKPLLARKLNNLTLDVTMQQTVATTNNGDPRVDAHAGLIKRYLEEIKWQLGQTCLRLSTVFIIYDSVATTFLDGYPVKVKAIRAMAEYGARQSTFNYVESLMQGMPLRPQAYGDLSAFSQTLGALHTACEELAALMECE